MAAASAPQNLGALFWLAVLVLAPPREPVGPLVLLDDAMSTRETLAVYSPARIDVAAPAYTGGVACFLVVSEE